MGFDEQEYTKSFDIRSWKKLLPFLRPYRGLAAVVLALNVFCAVVDIALPLFQRYAIDEFIETGDVSGLPGFALFYGCVIGLQALTVILFTRRSMRIEMQLGRDMKRACFVHLQTLSLSYYNVTPVGYLLSRIMSDTNRIAGMIAWNMVDILWAIFYVLGVSDSETSVRFVTILMAIASVVLIECIRENVIALRRGCRYKNYIHQL